MTYSQLSAPKRIGVDETGIFYAIDSKGIAYDCHCPECNDHIVSWEHDYADTNNVGCVSWHICNDEEVVVIARNQDQNKLF